MLFLLYRNKCRYAAKLQTITWSYPELQCYKSDLNNFGKASNRYFSHTALIAEKGATVKVISSICAFPAMTSQTVCCEKHLID